MAGGAIGWIVAAVVCSAAGGAAAQLSNANASATGNPTGNSTATANPTPTATANPTPTPTPTATPIPIPNPTPTAIPTQDLGYADELIARARALRLSETDEWAALLHLYKPPLRRLRSEADGPDFFLADSGKYDPAAELEATLRAFFGPPVIEVIPVAIPDVVRTNVGAQHAQCRFPARYAFLKRALRFDPARLTEQRCPRFEDWRSRVDPGSASMVFAAAYVNHPASAFGHTFLRIDNKRATDQPLLGYAINYAAYPTTQNGILYALAGLTGQFRGYFSILPYYLKVKEYSDLESRDLWDYRLALTQDELDQMLRHVWELGSTWFDYWFLDENCSYHLLSLVEVARPGVKLRSHFPFYAVPIDTLRAVRDVPGLLGEGKRRPSLDTRMKARRATLSPEEVDLARRLAERKDAARADIEALAPERQIVALDTALDLAQYRLGDSGGDEQVAAAAERRLVALRARILAPSPEPRLPPSPPPDSGHRSALALLGGGSHAGAPFASLTLRGVLHDLVSASEGQMENQQLEMGRVELRFPFETRRPSLAELRLLRIESLDPFDPWTPKLAWRIATGYLRERLDGRELRFWELRGGPAIAFAPLGQLVYALPEAELAAGPDFAGPLRARLRPSLGLVLHPADLWHLRIEAAAIWDARDRGRLRSALQFEQALNVGRFQLRASGSWTPSDWGWQSAVGAYF